MKDQLNTLTLCAIAWLAAGGWLLAAQEPPEQENRCIECHGMGDIWEGDTAHLFVDVEALAADIHWQKKISCFDCHGGNPNTVELRKAHALEDGFRKIESPADVPDFCGHCHANAEYMQRFNPTARTDDVQRFWGSVHGLYLKSPQAADGRTGATCTSCHPAHNIRSAADPLAATHPLRLSETCGACHRAEFVELRKSVHSKAGEKKEDGSGTLMECRKCHGEDIHGLVPVKDQESPVYLDHQVSRCGGCHEEKLLTYNQSTHGLGLSESGLVVTAVCADCHGAHGIYYAPDRRSTVHPSKVAHTCGKCHAYIEQRLAASVHAYSDQPVTSAPGAADAARPGHKPSCTDCHQGHDHPEPTPLGNRAEAPNRCGNCHADYAHRYRLSLHGELTQLGYAPAATCSDCHGAHDIRHVADPASHLSAENRLQTCRQCHTNATVGFASFDPHVNHKDAQRYPGLHGIYAWIKFFVYFGFGIFSIHAILWFVRSFVQTLKYGRHRRLVSQQMAVVRFTSWDRTLYIVVIIAFLGLVLTGVPLRYSQFEWSHRLAAGLGGFESTSVWHHTFAVLLLVSIGTYLVQHFVGMFRRHSHHASWQAILLGPDSLVPNRRDVKDFLHMVGWFFGVSRKPTFEKWTYWEKLDFWGVVIGFGLLAASGLVLWFPGLFSRFTPGGTLNVAKMIHTELALVVGGFLFIIHVFNTHLRPEKFPLDMSRFTGLVSEEHLQMARPEYLERLRREGLLEEVLTVIPEKRWLRTIAWSAWSVLATGLILLAAIVLASIGE